VTQAHQILSERLPCVELLTGYEGMDFGTTGNVEADLLAITSVHPMREDAVRTLLAEGGGDWSLVERLMDEGALAEIEYRTQRFYVRRFPRVDARPADASEGENPA
jgi:hypothetical protein